MKIEIWSDVMCPFCYIGKKNFEQALDQLPFKDEVEVEWKSFQLDPTLQTGETKTTAEYFREKKGFPEEQAKQMTAQVVQMGNASGIEFNFDKALITNTFPAHKILHLAKKQGKSSEMEEELFKAHFLNGENVGSKELLSSIAEKLGITKDEALQTLSSEEFDYDVNQDIMEGRNNGVTGVPYFILNGKYAVSGAQPAALFVEALTQTYNETVKPFKSAKGSDLSCDTDGCSV
jgi:predicted DsbA family dithiol-disulfide isomerase